MTAMHMKRTKDFMTVFFCIQCLRQKLDTHSFSCPCTGAKNSMVYYEIKLE